jgi:hypothetical protein
MQVGETAEALIDLFASDGELCPCCWRAKHPSATLREAPAVIESHPDQLGLDDLPSVGDGRHGTARHHLIPPTQAWARVERLARIGAAVGFDINHPGNGIALPCPAAAYRDGDRSVPFDALAEDQRARIARFWMRELGLPWHDAADAPDEGALDHPGYDQAVIARLVRELALITLAAPCRDEVDRSQELRWRLEAISDEIRAKLTAFAQDPRASAPFVVSVAAAAFAAEGAAR